MASREQSVCHGSMWLREDPVTNGGGISAMNNDEIYTVYTPATHGHPLTSCMQLGGSADHHPSGKRFSDFISISCIPLVNSLTTKANQDYD